MSKETVKQYAMLFVGILIIGVGLPWYMRHRDAVEHAEADAYVAAKLAQSHAEDSKAKSDVIALPGETVLLSGTVGMVPVCPTVKDWEDLKIFTTKKDQEAINVMATLGNLFPCQNGTRAVMIKRGWEAHEIKIIAGEHAGKTGLVKTSFVQKI